jgi:hypothetical protein
MKTIYTLIIAAFTLAACNETPEQIDIPEPTSYDVQLFIECDSCQGGITFNNDIYFFDSVVGQKQFDTVLFEGESVYLSAIDYYPDNSNYYTKIIVDGIIVADSLSIGNDSLSYIVSNCFFIL